MKRTVKVGSRLKDNNPRRVSRVLRVIEIDKTHCTCLNDKWSYLPKVRISLNRIYCDGKQRRIGFDLVD